MQFGHTIKVMRTVRGFTQAQLATSADISSWDLSIAESGRLNLKPEEQERIRRALDWPLSADALLDKLAASKWEG